MENNIEAKEQIAQLATAEKSHELPKIGWLRGRVRTLVIALGLALSGGAMATTTGCTFDKSGLARPSDDGGVDGDVDGGDGDVPTEICDNGLDDDNDGLVDCEDPDCDGVAVQDGTCSLTEDCGDDFDNNRDGLKDCADTATCAGFVNEDEGTFCKDDGSKGESDCTDGTDNDGDWAEDCEDPDCDQDPACQPTTETNCNDNVDNDNDGATDCDDDDCALDPICNPTEDCSNGVDDDGDSLADCADPDCTGYQDPAGWECDASGIKIEYLCDDTNDNDGDGFIDRIDADCYVANAWDTACNAGSHDGDSCFTLAPNPPCNIGVCNENLTCVTPNDPQCGPESNCSDGIDNNGDGTTDCADPSCENESCGADCICGSDGEPHQTVCTPGSDGDNDGWAGCIDADCQTSCTIYDRGCGGVNTGDVCNVGPSQTCSPYGICSEYGICVCDQ